MNRAALRSEQKTNAMGKGVELGASSSSSHNGRAMSGAVSVGRPRASSDSQINKNIRHIKVTIEFRRIEELKHAMAGELRLNALDRGVDGLLTSLYRHLANIADASSYGDPVSEESKVAMFEIFKSARISQRSHETILEHFLILYNKHILIPELAGNKDKMSEKHLSILMKQASIHSALYPKEMSSLEQNVMVVMWLLLACIALGVLYYRGMWSV